MSAPQISGALSAPASARALLREVAWVHLAVHAAAEPGGDTPRESGARGARAWEHTVWPAPRRAAPPARARIRGLRRKLWAP